MPDFEAFDFTKAEWILTLLAVFLSANITMIKSSIALISKNFDSTRDTEKHIIRISQLWETKHFVELLVLARTTYNSAIAILLYGLAHGKLHFLENETFVMFSLLIGIAFFLYAFTIFIPNLLVRLHPYRLAHINLIVFSFSNFIFSVFAKISHWIFERLEKHLGYDERLNFLTDDEKEQIKADLPAEDEDSLEEDEKQMIRNIMDFGETPVKEIMTPRIDMVSLDAQTPLEKVVSTLNEARHSRIPIYGENQDNILGILHSRDFLQWYTENRSAETVELEALIRPAYFVPKKKMIDDLMREFRRTQSQIAIVVDEYGGTSGIVTLEDVLEEIVGEIRDEDDDEKPRVQRVHKGRYLINPVISLADLSEELDKEFLPKDEETNVDSLGGLLQAELGRVPRKGDEVVRDEYSFKILKMEGQRVEKVLLIVKEEEKEA